MSTGKTRQRAKPFRITEGERFLPRTAASRQADPLITGRDVKLLRTRVATARSQLNEAREDARLAKRRRKEAKQIARSARKKVKKAKAELSEARKALAAAVGKCAKPSVGKPVKAKAAGAA